ncbi:hypothetical protein N8303_06060 [Gammaproteobacteria bacterium]|jgi:hypothetical protein|nr:hypothetical protein [Gammaproteobacteria bacterium]
MQDSMENSIEKNVAASADIADSTDAPSNSSSQQNQLETRDDTDADAFAILSMLFITACTIVYYLS